MDILFLSENTVRRTNKFTVMSSFSRLASVVILIAGAQVLAAERVCATAEFSLAEFSSQQHSAELLSSAKGWQPPDNGGPDDSNQGAGSR